MNGAQKKAFINEISDIPLNPRAKKIRTTGKKNACQFHMALKKRRKIPRQYHDEKGQGRSAARSLVQGKHSLVFS